MTVLFRVFMAIPHFIILAFLSIAAVVVAFLGWWGALFTGRLPEFATSYLTEFIRWWARVYAYMYLLTDAYPPFALADVPDYPVRVATTRETLNRAAVFFRFILVIPVYLLNGILGYGAGTIVLFITWVIALVNGRVPVSLHLAYAAVLRFQVRFFCYWSMLTPTYPGGLFGDGDAGTAPPPEPGAYDPPEAAEGWRLFLTPAAKRLVVLFIVLGVLGYAAQATAQQSVTRPQVSTVNQSLAG